MRPQTFHEMKLIPRHHSCHPFPQERRNYYARILNPCENRIMIPKDHVSYPRPFIFDVIPPWRAMRMN